MKTWLLVDISYLGYRALYTTGGLTHAGSSTGVAFGILRDLEKFIDMHDASRTILAFDGGGAGLRGQIYPNYKGSRKNVERTPEEQLELENFYKEMDLLKRKILPDAGFNNIITCRGYEADDIIAEVAFNLPPETEAVVISADQDLLQCVGERVIFYNPTTKKVVTLESFKKTWGILPSQWPSVKALAGCSTDDVEGIKGIGEITACKWFKGSLNPTTEAYKKISENLHVYDRNIGLVRLPFPGLELPELQEDAVSLHSLTKVRSDLGIRTRRKGGFDL